MSCTRANLDRPSEAYSSVMQVMYTSGYFSIIEFLLGVGKCVKCNSKNYSRSNHSKKCVSYKGNEI